MWEEGVQMGGEKEGEKGREVRGVVGGGEGERG